MYCNIHKENRVFTLLKYSHIYHRQLYKILTSSDIFIFKPYQLIVKKLVNTLCGSSDQVSIPQFITITQNNFLTKNDRQKLMAFNRNRNVVPVQMRCCISIFVRGSTPVYVYIVYYICMRKQVKYCYQYLNQLAQ